MRGFLARLLSSCWLLRNHQRNKILSASLASTAFPASSAPQRKSATQPCFRSRQEKRLWQGDESLLPVCGRVIGACRHHVLLPCVIRNAIQCILLRLRAAWRGRSCLRRVSSPSHREPEADAVHDLMICCCCGGGGCADRELESIVADGVELACAQACQVPAPHLLRA